MPRKKKAKRASGGSSCFEKHARDLESVVSVLSEDEKQRLYTALKKAGLFAAERAKEIAARG